MLVPQPEFAAAEVAPAEGVNVVDAPTGDDPLVGRFTWTIENFSRLSDEKLYSDVFFAGGYHWRVSIYPKGNGVDHLSMYLDAADSTMYDWSRCAQFSLAVVDQIHGKFTKRKDSQHQFHAQKYDWGFTTFMPFSELYDLSKGYLLNDTCIVEAHVEVRKVADYRSHDSINETGYVGLTNQVASAEAANAVDAPAVDDPPPERFTWIIENFSKLTDKKLYSDVFFAGGYQWRVLIYPKGNGVDHLSMYLDAADSTMYDWSRCAQFSLAVVDQIDGKFTKRKYSQHQFHEQLYDWGFTTFMPFSELYDPKKGYLLNDTCIVEAHVAVRRAVDYWSHDSKNGSGYIGLTNQVAPAEAANAIDAPVVDRPSARFTWRIENFSKLTGRKAYSDVFFAGGYKWRVLIYPKGNGEDHLSMYLDAADSSTLSYGWRRYAQFSLAVVDQIHGKFTMRKDTQHLFHVRESDWGFTNFLPRSELYDPSNGYLLNDTCIIEADVAV